MKPDISVFDNHLMNGLLFCKRVYDLFANIRSSPEGIKGLRLRNGKIEKKLIEELIPIARYVQARYSHGRQLKVRWVDGCQHFDAKLLSAGPMADRRLVPKRQFIEVTTAVHEYDHFSRRLIDEQGGTFSVKGMNLAPFGQTLKISDTDSCLNCLKRSTDYTTLYFINAAAFMKWKHCLNNGAIVQTI
jgi:hypothetical protein